jgi:DNA (cytosine-5)-methyltransferase 1
MRPKALDLFCGAGGASMGLHRAGFDVTGVDIRPQPRYPFRFVQSDALTYPLEGFGFIWASPPCQAYTPASSVQRSRGVEYPDLIHAVRTSLSRSKAAWVIENVSQAPLGRAILLCGLMFGLRLLRHRRFESSMLLLAPAHIRHSRGMGIRGEIFTVAGFPGSRTSNRKPGASYPLAKRDQARLAMGIDWMIHHEVTQAVPPEYSEFIGRQVLRTISSLPYPAENGAFRAPRTALTGVTGEAAR